MTVTTPTTTEKAQGLVCPNCAAAVPVAEGQRIARCPACSLYSLVQGDRGVQRWQVARRIERAPAEEGVRAFMSGMRKARDLRRMAKVTDLMLVYLPFWRVNATVAGWLFGRVKSGDDSTKPDEEYIFEAMQWNDAAVDVTEFGVHRIVVGDIDLQPFDSERLHAEAMVFEPSESRTEALTEALQHFSYRSRSKANQTSTFYERIEMLHPEFSLVYYPVWVVRYAYRQRTYQVVIDGVSGRVMYGKAPGNIMYRAATLVAGLAAGNLILVNGTILAGLAASGDDDGLGILLLPIALGLGLILWGYRSFRYGEEVEDKPKEHQKAFSGSRSGGLFGPLQTIFDLPKIMSDPTRALEQLTKPPGVTRK